MSKEQAIRVKVGKESRCKCKPAMSMMGGRDRRVDADEFVDVMENAVQVEVFKATQVGLSPDLGF